jgi:hypothetical protein
MNSFSKAQTKSIAWSCKTNSLVFIFSSTNSI